MTDVYMPITPPDGFEIAPYGLVSVLNTDVETDTHWRAGVQYDVECTRVSVTSSPCVSGSPDSSVLTKDVTWARDTRGARAFTVYDRVDCSAAGGGWEEGRARAVLALQRSYQDQLEATFWTGSSGHGAPVFPNLTTAGPIFDETGRILLQPASGTLISGTGGAALDVVEAVGRLEDAMARSFSGLGVLHVPAILGAALFSRNICYRQGSQLRTYAGNYVALGQGYPGTGLNGAAPTAGSIWIRATSRPWAISGDIRTFPPVSTLDRNVDTVEAIAEQTWLIGWNCGGPLAVLATTGGEQAGAYGTDKQDT